MAGLTALVLDDKSRGVFRVNREAFLRGDVLEAEQRHIFDRSWLYAGHVSEIPGPGDFVTRRVGGRPVILVRDTVGQPRAFINSCPHRGNLVCRERRGSTRMFTCFYHAWSFDLSGKLVGVPGEDAYTSAFERSEMGLSAVPRLENYRGMLFVSFDRDVADFSKYLGNAREYLDYTLDLYGDDCQIAEGQQAYSMRANWKLLVENSIDLYHAGPTHQRYFRRYLPDIGVKPGSWGNPTIGRGVALDNGHSMLELPAMPNPFAGKAWEEVEAFRARLIERYGPDRTHKILGLQRNLFIFPNLILIGMFRTVRTFYPVSPNYTEIDAWALLPANESVELRQKRLQNFISFLGPGGFGTPDDVAALEGCQRACAASLEIGWSDISRGMGRTEPVGQDELQMRAFWRRWQALLAGARGPTNCSDKP